MEGIIQKGVNKTGVSPVEVKDAVIAVADQLIDNSYGGLCGLFL